MRLVASLALSTALLTGCATVANPDPRDPLESYNRGMTTFNEHVDTLLLRPVATAYREAVPAPVRTGVSNFFANVGDLWSFVNNVLQGRGEAAGNSFIRFNVNTFLGLGGVLDIASEMGIDRYRQDFGLTLGRWGVGTGPYLVLPLLGPSTVRDAFALPVDTQGNLLNHVDPLSARNSLYALRVVDLRSNLLRASSVLDSAALDKYSFMRDVFLQVRSQAGEANNPDEDEEDTNEGVLPEEPFGDASPRKKPGAARP
ncbi:MlaA family lipoprotein [Verminephrobacter aporrectodeae]|uniref:VacJ family lipoprotein n=1 Tax=Verminephrobacter aporrectodeae subsp. tuberculatae TaxID=1110392 RepID=A0ABT3KVC2_9BURK|nr:VacJ family lipoprotein [Verminephrobacter aporrectodeae]MCW5223239.1 VacJ family lipoprotein [Verminephrobacter aporrectodeae subsp. tuberculatae]MCW5256550.1 VacJ family lipoprotein [Verminephrobacter aporrectodeae subsp. tuberculatae]MCW5288703.1 VacJ family lipoprotein [Verminephrobacter aporrectodeae subsp. tuberculatae]MCW5322290.1 VacJ family lipoprotein [Verminephrobacter aporrectodeae subsp. tuberculatae]MCW8165669.1 VacJ family lipoprotein [Verminephrobacter aporrectodeae subsp. t